MKIRINEDLHLSLFDTLDAERFYNAIHEINNEDQFRINLKKKHTNKDKTYDILIDAIENKYLIDGTPDFFIIYHQKIAGVFEFAPLEKDSDYVEVGYWLFKEYRNKGILTSVLPYMIKYAKENFDKVRLIATTPLNNWPSRKVLEKSGLKNTGKIQEFKKENGLIAEDIEYEILLNEMS